MDMLADEVAVVIGVDTHKHTHTAAAVDAVTSGVLAELTSAADPGGYAELLAMAGEHRGPRAWAVERPPRERNGSRRSAREFRSSRHLTRTDTAAPGRSRSARPANVLCASR